MPNNPNSIAFLQRRQFLRTSAVLASGVGLTMLGHAQDDSSRVAEEEVPPEAQQAIDQALAGLARSQSADGSFSDRNGVGNVAVTGLAGLAFLAAGHHPGCGAYGRIVSRAVDYTLLRGSRNSKQGYLHNAEAFLSHGAMYQHGFGALFLSEVIGTFPDAKRHQQVREMLEKALAITVNSQNRFGGWRYEPKPTDGDVSVTVAQLMALRAAKNAGLYVDKSVVDNAVKYIKGCRMNDGGYCYQINQPQTGSLFPRSAAAIVGLFSAGIYEGHPDYPEYVEKGLQYLLRYIPRPGQQPFQDIRQDHYFYAQYYAALAMWTAGGKYWNQWQPAIRNELLRKRNNSNMWDDFYGNAYATAMACIILQLPNNYLPIMQK